LLLLLGIETADTAEDIEWLSGKLVNLRIFDDENGVMNLDLQQTGGDLLLISQFTLHAATKKGNRPSYIKAAKPEMAIPVYEKMIQQLEKDLGKSIGTGVFGADYYRYEEQGIVDWLISCLVDGCGCWRCIPHDGMKVAGFFI
jgi:D-tyrosyl-tRNA(Tyr) deacylase